MRAIILAVALLLPSTAAAQEFKSYYATFHSCYDGDTCYFDFHVGAGVGLGVSLGAVMPKNGVRFCDIDTPEIRPRRGTAEEKLAEKRLAIVVRDILTGWLKNAREIHVDIPQKSTCDPSTAVNCDKKEKYGRWLGYVIADGVNLNEKLVEEGLAKILVSRVTGKPILCRKD